MIKSLHIGIVGYGTMGKIYHDTLSDLNFVCKFSIFTSNPHYLHQKIQPEGKIETNFIHTEKIHQINFIQDLNLDAVVITTPEWIRKSVISPFASLKLKIITDKPLSASEIDTQYFRSLCSEEATNIYVCNTLAFNPFYSHIYSAFAKNNSTFFSSSYRDSCRSRHQRIIGKISEFYWLAPHDVSLIVDASKQYPHSVAASAYPLNNPNTISYDLFFSSGSHARFSSSFFQTSPNGSSPLSAALKLHFDENTYEFYDSSLYNVQSYPNNLTPDCYEWPNNFSAGRGYLGLPVASFVKDIYFGLDHIKHNFPLDKALKIQSILDALHQSSKLGSICSVTY